MRLLPALAPLLAAGCVYKVVSRERICEDIAFAISEMTMVCEGDGDLANARYHEFMDEATCLWEGHAPPEDNPAGTLPMIEEEYGTEQEWLERSYACVQAIRQLPCEEVKANGGDIGWWLDADEGCDQVALAPGATADTGGADTGATP